MSDESNNILDLFKPYIEFTKKIEETDENINNISKIIKDSSKETIKKYYSRFFKKSLIYGIKYKNLIQFFRIITLNNIRTKNTNLFTSYKDFEKYIMSFKDKLMNDPFPDSFLDEINSVKDVPPFEENNNTYFFNFDFVKQFIEVKTVKLAHQFQNYGKFNFFRHFMLHATEESEKLKLKYPDLWNNLFNYLIEFLEIVLDDYFFDQCKYYMSSGRSESEVTWGALLKKDIDEFSVEEDKRESLQLYFMITPRGLDIGISLGNNPNDQIRSYIKKIVTSKKELLFKLLKNLKKKYPKNLYIHYNVGSKYFSKFIEDNFLGDDPLIQEKIFELFKIKFSVVFEAFSGNINEFNEIIKDLFELYLFLTESEDIKIYPPSEPFIIEKNLEKINYSNYKTEIIEKLEECGLIGIDIKKIVQKILKILESGKNIILLGAPGTGKTKILDIIFNVLKDKLKIIIDGIKFTTASSDWTVFETIGGLIPGASDLLDFRPGLFLKCFKDTDTGNNINKWLIVDELNRANIDKIFGYFFSLLSNQEVELPFQTIEGKRIKIIPLQKWIDSGLEFSEIIEKIGKVQEEECYYINPNWRMGGTINSSDKASLYQLSHAFIRRFGFVEIPIPEVKEFMNKYDFKSSNNIKGQIQKIWEILNKYYKIGPAIIIDIDNLLESQELTIFDAFEAYIFPQIDTLPDDTINSLINEIIKAFGEETEEGKRFEKYKVSFD